jgi:hypothetical protein
MRNIKPKMIAFLDKKLGDNGAAIEAIKRGDARTLMLQAALSCEGIREEGGNNRGPMVQLIQSTIGSANREAWCMSFVQTMIAYAEVKTGVKSPLVASEHCMTTWNKTPKTSRVKIAPLPGAVIIWQHGKTTNGHTGFVIGADNKTILSIEGNTESGLNSKGEVEREGGGVWRCKRGLNGNGSMKVVGFLIPFPKVKA